MRRAVELGSTSPKVVGGIADVLILNEAGGRGGHAAPVARHATQSLADARVDVNHNRTQARPPLRPAGVAAMQVAPEASDAGS